LTAFPQTAADWGLYSSDMAAGVAVELSRHLRQAEKDLIQHLRENCTASGEIKDMEAFKTAVYECFERHLISTMKRHLDVGAADTTPQRTALDYLFHVAAQHCDATLDPPVEPETAEA